MRIFLALSHKGGTGRSVTTANLAQRFAKSGRHVAVVDFDLASPTFASIFGMSDIAAGVPYREGRPPNSVADFLENENNCRANLIGNAMVNLWRSSALSREQTGGAFKLLPGRQGYGDLAVGGAAVATKISTLLDKIGDLDFDYVFCDLRSGLSEVVHAFTQPILNSRVAGWLFHFRWTEQHLSGFEDLISSPIIKNAVEPGKLHVIRTAFPDVDSLPQHMRAWATDYSSRLGARWSTMTYRGQAVCEREIGTIPFEPLLLWKETLVLSSDVTEGRARRHTFEALDATANTLLRTAE